MSDEGHALVYDNVDFDVYYVGRRQKLVRQMMLIMELAKIVMVVCI